MSLTGWAVTFALARPCFAYASGSRVVWPPPPIPKTGERDADTLRALNSWDHQDFGVYAEVIKGGEIRVNDEVQVL